jgi:3-isopropylmalate dehydrogenase
MSKRIALLPGDGIGPEVIAEAVKVLRAAAEHAGATLAFSESAIGGNAMDACGTALPDETLATCQASDAVLLGAVGGPQWDDPLAKVRPEQGLLGLRQGLGVFANLRPVKVHPVLAAAGPLKEDRVAGVDLVIVRELTGGIYFGDRGHDGTGANEQAFDTMHYRASEIERVVRLAARLARARCGRLTSVDKANVLEVSRLWRRRCTAVIESSFADVTLDHLLVDAASMHLIQKPASFDVLVTGNLFGDILSDEASVLAGSMGMLPSASLGDGGPGLYEPIHGSAPDLVGQGKANPIGMILSAAMMCRESLNLPEAAIAIESAVKRVLDEGARTPDLVQPGEAAISTTAMGDRISDAVSRVVPAGAEAVQTSEHR